VSVGSTELTRSGLQIDELRVARGGHEVLHGVSLEIAPGAVTTLLGPNGAGKSTLVLAAGGVLRTSGGDVTVDGKSIAKLRPEQIRKAGVAVVPEGRRLLPDLTVEDNLRVATYALSRDDAKAGLARALELFPHLQTRWNATARTLSGGEQQMVVLAQALVSRPKFMLVDELSLGLAPVVVQRMLELVDRLKERGQTMIVVEQSLNVALAISDRAIFLEKGEVKFEGNAQELMERDDLARAVFFGTEGG
jgi:branched-chain amino acid transport system ATP-binding protein